VPQSGTPTDTVPAATLYRWQRRAQQQLAKFLAQGAKRNLRPLVWTIATSGALTGNADGFSNTPEQQRAAVTADHPARRHRRQQPDRRRPRGAVRRVGENPVKSEMAIRACFRATIFLHREGA
jgi:hypothetical protein